MPLRAPHTDVVLDLQTILDTVYARGRYAKDLDYSRPVPPPPLRPADAVWSAEQIAGWRRSP